MPSNLLRQIIVEDEDGEVVKTYELPPQKPAGQEGTRINNSLKYLGLGALARHPEKSPPAAMEEGRAGESSAAGAAASSSRPVFKPGWTSGFGGKKGVAHQDDSDDDRKIRFTIGGVGRRMTKEDFIREVQKLDASTRKEVVDRSSASTALKDLARQDLQVQGTSRPLNIPEITIEPESSSGPASTSASTSAASTSVSPAPRGSYRDSESVSPRRQADAPRARDRSGVNASVQPSELDGETAVERNRRLAALGGQRGETERSSSAVDVRQRLDDTSLSTGETPAERRRREAALGVGGPTAAEDSDSDDEGTPRVPPARRGIRFAEQPSRQMR